MKKNSRKNAAEKKTNRRRQAITLALAAAVLVIFGVLTIWVGKPLAMKFQESPEVFRAYVEEHRVLGSFLMMGLVMFQVIVAFVPGEPFELGAGFVFGWFQGTVLCLVGAGLASALVYTAVRKWGMKLVEVFFPKEKILGFSFLQNQKKLNLLVFLMFLIPGTPKDLLTYLVGLTPMSLPIFLCLTTVARIPSVVSSTVSGHLTESGNYLAAAVTYGITLLITASCTLWYREISKREQLSLR